MISRLFLFAVVTLLYTGKILALTALQGSPCYEPCHGDQQTNSTDVVCTDQDFTNSTKGNTLTQCLKCLQRSNYKSGSMSDSTLFLYYISSVQQTCLSGVPGPPISTCTSNCTNLPSSFSSIGGKALFADPWAYCTINNNTYLYQAPTCAKCLQSQAETVILGNLVFAGNIGCVAAPNVANGEAVYLPDDLFTTTILGSNGTKSYTTASPSPTISSVSSTTPTIPPVKSSTTSDGDQSSGGGLSRGAAAAIGLVLGIVGIAGIVAGAIFARRYMAQKQSGNGPTGKWQKMGEKPADPPKRNDPIRSNLKTPTHGDHSSLQATPITKRTQNSKQPTQANPTQRQRGPTPPAPGVSVPPSGAVSAISKRTKSFKSMGSRSMKSLRSMTPRTSQWRNAAHPEKSVDLTSLPQKGWD